MKEHDLKTWRAPFNAILRRGAGVSDTPITTPRTDPPNTGSLAIDVCRVWATLALPNEKIELKYDGYPQGHFWGWACVALKRELPDVEFFSQGTGGEFGGLSAQSGKTLDDLEIVFFKWDRDDMRVDVKPFSHAAKTRMLDVLEREGLSGEQLRAAREHMGLPEGERR